MTRSGGTRLVLAATSGVLLVLSFPKFGWAPVAFVALVPLLFALDGASRRFGFLCGLFGGTVAALGLLYWTSAVVAHYGGASGAMAAFATVALAVAFALFPAAFGWAQASLFAAFGARAALLAPFLWVTSEFLREHCLFGFAWCLLGYSQAEFIELIQISTITAVHGVSFLVVLVSSACVFALKETDAERTRRGLSVAAATFGCALGYGHFALQRPLEQGTGFLAAAIQASIPQDQKWQDDLLISNIEKHETLSRQAIAAQARLIVWPESAVGPEVDLYPEVRGRLQALTKESGVFLLFGNDDRERDGSGAVLSYVGAKLMTPTGDLALRYHKLRLVPFGEYMPRLPIVGQFGPIERLVEGVSDFSPGTEPRVADVMGVRTGAFICYEAIFPSLVRKFTAGGAELLVNITNDAWYGTSSAPYQHFAMARFRAVENRRYLIRAANTGISAIVDPFGRVVAKTGLFEERALVGEVNAVSGLTFYARYGDVFAWSVAFVSLLLVGISERSIRKTASIESGVT